MLANILRQAIQNDGPAIPKAFAQLNVTVLSDRTQWFQSNNWVGKTLDSVVNRPFLTSYMPIYRVYASANK